MADKFKFSAAAFGEDPLTREEAQSRLLGLSGGPNPLARTTLSTTGGQFFSIGGKTPGEFGLTQLADEKAANVLGGYRTQISPEDLSILQGGGSPFAAGPAPAQEAPTAFQDFFAAERAKGVDPSTIRQTFARQQQAAAPPPLTPTGVQLQRPLVTVDSETGEFIMPSGQRISTEGLSPADVNNLRRQAGLAPIEEPSEPKADEAITREGVGGEGQQEFREAARGVTGEAAGVTLGLEGQRIQDEIDRVLELRKGLVGREEFEAGAERDIGLTEKENLVTDLETSMKQLSNRALGLRTALERGAERGGITTEILGRKERKLLQDITLESLAISSNLEAARGNVLSAKRNVAELVEAEFGPIEESIDLALENLDLLSKSPGFTAEQARMKEAQDLILFAQKDELKRQKDTKEDVFNIANDAIANGLTDAGIIDKIKAAGDTVEASRLAAEALRSVAPVVGGGGGVVGGRLGGPVPEGDAAPVLGLDGKPLSNTESTALGFARRMADADDVIKEVGAKFTGPLSILTGLSFFPNILKSSERQRFDQAKRNFINAVLRKESGAAIAPSEFDSAEKQYFPQPGDKPDVLKQKADNRRRAINNFTQSANVAHSAVGGASSSYEEYLKSIGK